MNPTRPFDARKLPDDASMRQVPSLMEAVEGWRAWSVERRLPMFGNPPKLESITHGKKIDGGYWTPRRAAEAVCPKYVNRPDMMPHNHVASRGCKCGFYSAKTFDHLHSLGYDSPSTMKHHGYEHASHALIVGRVKCWGTVTEGRQGWRSQFCYPAHLFVPPEASHLIKPLRAAYGIPVVSTLLIDVIANTTTEV